LKILHKEVEHANTGTICLKDSLVDEPVDWVEETSCLDIQDKVEKEATSLVSKKCSSPSLCY
jgi:hypothetical protein